MAEAVEDNKQANTAVLYKLSRSTIIPAKSQSFVQISMVNKTNDVHSANMLFEPFNFADNIPEGCMFAKSLNSNLNTDAAYVNVVNASDQPIELKKDVIVGQAYEVEESLKQFNEDIKRYEEPPKSYFEERALKRMNKIKIDPVRGAKIGSSKQMSPEEYLTADDLINHEIRNKLREIKINNNLSRLQQMQLFEVVLNNLDAFQWNEKDLGKTNLAVHGIPTGEHTPVVLRQYQIPDAAKVSLNKQVDDMLETRVIRESSSTWRSPVLLIRKKNNDGSIQYRFCIDLRKVNSITSKDCYSLPLIQDTVNALNGSKYFTTMDVDRAFWQIPVLEQDKKKLAFCVDGKLYECNVMPFGSMNAPATFQRLIDRVLKGLTWKQCLVYIDDVLVFSKTFEKHLLDINEVMNRFKLSGLKLKPSKCSFGAQSAEYLGYNISEQGIKISTKKLDAITKLKPPDTNKLLYSFLCSIKYYHGLVPKITELTADLFKMAEDRKKVCVWTPELLAKYEKLKQALITGPILAFPDPDKPFVIQTDASSTGISGVLLQQHGQIWKPVDFYSRKLNPAESRYSTTEREMLAVRDSYFHFINMVMDRDLTFVTDHEPLVTAHRLRNPMGRLAKLFNDLVDVTYKMKWIKGSENYLPDFLSRANLVDTKEVLLHVTEIKSTIDWSQEQSNDDELKNVIYALVNDLERSEWFKMLNGRRWFAEKSKLFVNNENVLCHSSNKIICPTNLRKLLLQTHHDIPTAGHRASETTLISLRERYFWFNMPTDVAQYCSTCDKCQMFNYANKHNVAPMKSIQLASRPMQLLGADFMGPFKVSRSGNMYVMLVIDHWTKYAFAVALPSMSAEVTAQVLLNQVVGPFGMFEYLLTDQGPNFESNLIKHLCKLMGVDKLHTTTYHPPCNGGTERTNKTVKPNLAKYVNDEHSNWDEYLALAINSYNSAFHSTIGMSPFEALFARPPVSAVDVILANKLDPSTKASCISEFVRQLRVKAVQINDLIEQNTKISQERQKFGYDKSVTKLHNYKIGDLVKIKNFRTRLGHSKSFENKFIGPFKIVRLLGDLDYELINQAGKIERVHYNRMYQYHARDNNLVNEFQFKPRPKKVTVERNKPNQQVNDLQIVNLKLPGVRRSARLINKPAVNYNGNNNWARFLELEADLFDDVNEHEVEVNNWLRANEMLRTNHEDEDWMNNVIDHSRVQAEFELEYEAESLYDHNSLDKSMDLSSWSNSDTQDTSLQSNNGEGNNADWAFLDNLAVQNNSNESGNISDDSSTIDEIDEITMYNDKGKPVIKCTFCEKYCEIKYGLRAHVRLVHPETLIVEIVNPNISTN